MKRTRLTVFNILLFLAVAVTLIGLGVAKAQRSSLTITDAQGKEVIVYKESHALVIWAGKKYQYWDRLESVEDEAKDVVAELEKQGFQVEVLPEPNGNQLKSGIESFIRNYGYEKDNRLVIFFAGHGFTRQKTKGYLLPVDAPVPISRQEEQDFLKVSLSMEQINSWATQMEAKHVLFVFDSCFSGTIFKQRSNSGSKEAYIQAVMNKPVRQFLTAGDADQKVPSKSVFTPLFLRALEGAADFTKDGYVTGSELGLYLRQDLSNYTKTQTPQFGTIRDPELDQGDIVFRLQPVTLPPPQHKFKPPVAVIEPPKITPPNLPPQPLLISSTTEVDYAPLQKLLQQKKWKEADDITFKLILESSKHQNQDWTDRGWLNEKDINNFACEDLKIIDRLWFKHSGNQLGLSIQLKFWNDAINSSTNIIEAYRQFAEWVKWIRPSSSSSGNIYISSADINYANPSQGHLPVQITYPLGEGWSNGGSHTNRNLLYSHFADCLKKGN